LEFSWPWTTVQACVESANAFLRAPKTTSCLSFASSPSSESSFSSSRKAFSSRSLEALGVGALRRPAGAAAAFENSLLRPSARPLAARYLLLLLLLLLLQRKQSSSLPFFPRSSRRRCRCLLLQSMDPIFSLRRRSRRRLMSLRLAFLPTSRPVAVVQTYSHQPCVLFSRTLLTTLS